jgi:hypothetical protein
MVGKQTWRVSRRCRYQKGVLERADVSSKRTMKKEQPGVADW